jgi:hypothetical protein
MTIKALKTIQAKDYVVDTIQRNVKDFSRQLELNPLLAGIMVKDVALSASSSNTVNHKLGRALIGWIIVRNNANANVWENATQALPARNITLETSADCTVSIYIF